jgi:hypothetical protein
MQECVAQSSSPDRYNYLFCNAHFQFSRHRPALAQVRITNYLRYSEAPPAFFLEPHSLILLIQTSVQVGYIACTFPTKKSLFDTSIKRLPRNTLGNS